MPLRHKLSAYPGKDNVSNPTLGWQSQCSPFSLQQRVHANKLTDYELTVIRANYLSDLYTNTCSDSFDTDTNIDFGLLANLDVDPKCMGPLITIMSCMSLPYTCSYLRSCTPLFQSTTLLITLLKLDNWVTAMKGYPNAKFVDYIATGIKHGFHIGFQYGLIQYSSAKANAKSALSPSQLT